MAIRIWGPEDLRESDTIDSTTSPEAETGEDLLDSVIVIPDPGDIFTNTFASVVDLPLPELTLQDLG
eukprot:1467339-Amphidinium_carterae.2